MNDWLARLSRECPDAAALITSRHRLNWLDLAECARLRAGILAEQGIGRDSVVAVEAENSLEAVCWMHAVFWLGATLFPLQPRLPPIVLKQRLSRLAPAALVTGDPGRVAATALPGECPVLALMPPDKSTNSGPPPADMEDKDILTILWTSGSSGPARAVPLSMANHVASTRAIARRLGVTVNDRWLLCLPLDHIGGLAILIRAMITGASVVVHEHFEPERIRTELAAEPITLASMVPTMLARLVEDSSRPWQSSLRALLIGGAPAAPELLTRARSAGLPVVPTWGMTETCSQLATMDPAEAGRIDFMAHPGLVGKPLAGIELRLEPDPVCSDAHQGNGLLQVRGPMVFKGYLDSDKPPALEDGDWFDTGDVGWIDEQGRVIMGRRASDLIISGGVNIHAGEVEQVLLRSAWVEDVAVFGLPHPIWGEQVVAVVAMGDDQRHDDDMPATLTQWCRQHLEPAQVPRRWRLLARLPRTATGKCRRSDLEALFADESEAPTAST